jgi:predicted ArsR family transcriptional regulator
VKNDRPGLGPRPARRASRRPALPASRESVLEALEERPEPTAIAALTTVTGLHVNTLREHLDALSDAGLVRRERAPAAGRGRPAWLYSAVPHDELSGGAAEYADLASALAEVIEQSSNSPRRDAIDAGRRWGRQLAADRGPGGESEADARRRVVQLLDGLGFAPQPDARHVVVRLTRCPLLEAARRHPEIVCGVHLGIVCGALEVHGGVPEHADLLAFSEPGACRLDLGRPGCDDDERQP